MSDHDKLLVKTVPLYMLVFVATVVALDRWATGMGIEVMLALAGGAVAALAIVLELRHWRRHRHDDGRHLRRVEAHDRRLFGEDER